MLHLVLAAIALSAPQEAPQGSDEKRDEFRLPDAESLAGRAAPGRAEGSLQLIVLLSALSLAPSLLMMLTSFTRIAIVLAFLRRALGTQDLPPNSVVVGLSLLLTFLVMSPVIAAVKADAIDPYVAERIESKEAVSRAEVHLRAFMWKHTREQDAALLMSVTKQPEKPEGWTEDDVPTQVLVPAFVLSELRRAFVMGFALFLPFLVIDLVVAAALASMGLVMLPPVLVSLPFKLLLFVLVDGWALVVGSLVAGFF